MKGTAKWTLMVYMAGDNSLSPAGEKDLHEMRAVGSKDDVNIVAEFDNEGNRGTNRYHIKRNGVGEHVTPLGETDSGDPDILIDFINWAAEKYPAERYALVLWNHGGGWEPSEITRIAQSVNSTDYNVREANERRASSLGRAFFRTTLEKIFSLSSPSERAICSDDGSSHSLDTLELGNVLSHTRKILDKPLDLLGMDACLMSNLEVAYQAQTYARYIVASEENEPGDGWPYDSVLREIAANPDMPTQEFAKTIVEKYTKSYVERGFSGDVTQAALNLSKISALAKPIDDLSRALTDGMDKAKYEIEEALYESKARFYNSTLWDIGNVCEKLSKRRVDGDTRQTTRDVLTTLRPNNENFVIAESHHGAKVNDCRGVTIYIPPRVLHGISPYYKDLAYAQDHLWLRMLEAYHTV